jgi:sulfate permease, SulP family
MVSKGGGSQLSFNKAATDAAVSAAASSLFGRISLRSLQGDMAGGLAATLIAVPQAMSLGLLAFAALGPAFAPVGVIAALLSSVIGNFVSAALPGARCQIMGARASATVVFAGIVAALAAHPLLQTAQGPDAERVMALAFGALFLSGVFMMLFAWTGLGRAIKFVPHPVAAGFMNGIALVILLSQIGPALGLEPSRSLLASLADWRAIRPGSVAVTATVIATIFLAPRITRKVPAVFCGLLVGVAVHSVATGLFPGSAGPVIGALPGMDVTPQELGTMVQMMSSSAVLDWLPFLLLNALVLAAVVAVDGLLACVVGDTVIGEQHRSDRVLAGQGAAQMLASFFGALPMLMNTHTRVANHLAGGRSPFASLFHALFMLAVIFVLAPLISYMPIAALAGLMIYIAYTLVDRWTGDLVRRLRVAPEHRVEIVLNLGIVAGVALVLALANVMAAFALGVSATILMLLARLSGSPVRRMLDGSVRTSLKIRRDADRARLHSLGHCIRIFELDGEIFFGTADTLRVQVEALPREVRYLILDFRRVHGIDASGARGLHMIGSLATRHGMRVLFSHVREGDLTGKYLRALGIDAVVPTHQWHPDLDRALEWAEDSLLETERFRDAPELRPGELGLFRTLNEAEMASLLPLLERHEARHGDVIFHEGDPADRLYLISRGFVSIKLKLADDRAMRLATFSPGVFFGDLAMIEGGKRSADGFAKGEHVVLYSLSTERFAGLMRTQPEVALKIYGNLTRELAGRLRATSYSLRALE